MVLQHIWHSYFSQGKKWDFHCDDWWLVSVMTEGPCLTLLLSSLHLSRSEVDLFQLMYDDSNKDDDNEDWAVWHKNICDFCKIRFHASFACSSHEFFSYFNATLCKEVASKTSMSLSTKRNEAMPLKNHLFLGWWVDITTRADGISWCYIECAKKCEILLQGIFSLHFYKREHIFSRKRFLEL